MPYNASGKTLITKENAYVILKTFAKEYKKTHKNKPLEIIIVGGGSILLNYGFRDSTQDFDIMVRDMGDVEDIADKVAALYNLPAGWLNTDFRRTASFSKKLREISKYFCSFNNGHLEFRTVSDEYLIAMKMISARDYRNDISDIIGIISDMKRNNREISIEKIDEALNYLYPNAEISSSVYEEVKSFLAMTSYELDKHYIKVNNIEKEVKQELVLINETNPELLKEQPVASVTKAIKKRLEKKS